MIDIEMRFKGVLNYDKKKCFLICPIGSEGSSERKRADYLLKYIIEKSFTEFDYTIIRADRIAKPGMITNQIVEGLIDADIVIADLKDANPNVFYELGIRHTLNKPVIQIYYPNQKIPFDVSGLRSIKLDITDLKSVENCINELKKQVQAIEEHPEDLTSPFSIAFDLKEFKSSDTSNELILSRILESVDKLRTEVHSQKPENIFGELARSSHNLRKKDNELDLVEDQIVNIQDELASLNPTEKERASILMIHLDELRADRFNLINEINYAKKILRLG